VVGKKLREAITRLGSAGGTVSAVNSLQGACLIQGVLVAFICRQHLDESLPITESHPKALLWLLKIAKQGHKPEAVVVDELRQFISPDRDRLVEHERDAALGALAAFAMHSGQLGWNDLYLLEPDPVVPVAQPLGYWMPPL
jgi:hypothetical protein